MQISYLPTTSSIIYLQIVGFVIKLDLVKTEYQQAKKLFLSQFFKTYKGFIIESSNKKPDFTIHIEQSFYSEIFTYKSKNYVDFYKNTKDKTSIITYYSISIEQLSILLRYILYLLMKKSGFFMHGSVGIDNNKALLFLGPSGRGKSTILRILKKDILPFADDVFAIRKIDNEYYSFQTPSLDKQSWIKKNHKGYPIKALYILRQSKKTYLRKETIQEMRFHLVTEIVSNVTTQTSFVKNYLSFISVSHPLFTLFFSKKKQSILNVLGLQKKP